MRLLLPILLCLLFTAVTSGRAAPAVDPGDTPELQIPRLPAESLNMDGVLDEPVWDRALLLSGFSQHRPVDGRPAVDSTHVLVWYDATSIHFGIRAFEVHGEVRATLADRDKLDVDDHVVLVLDTYNDQRQAIVIVVNPLGQQADGILRDTDGSGRFVSGGGSYSIDLSPDYRFQSRGRQTEFGFEVEVSVPFKSLRFQSELVQDWGFNVIRNIAHSGYSTTWTPVAQANASFLSQNGRLSGLTDLRRGLVLDISPEITASANRAAGDSPFDAETRDPLGVNVRWGVTNNLTMNGTVNPDFSQVEADVAQIQFDPRQALFFPEKRPFFLDGIELFQSPTNLIYTRRVSNPLTAAKLTGKIGGTNVALLSAVDNTEPYLSDLDARYFNAVRLRRDLRGQNTIGVVYTDKVDGDHWNRVAAVDGRLVSGIYSATYQLGASFTGDPGEATTAPMWRFSTAASGRRYGATFSAFGFHEDFNAEAGFIQRVGVAHLTFTPRMTFFGEDGSKVESFTAGITLDGEWDYDRFTNGDGPNDRKLHFNSSYSLRGGWSGGTSVFYESFKYPADLYVNYFIAPGPEGGEPTPYVGTNRLTNIGFWSVLSTPRWKQFSANMFVVAGRDDNFFEWSRADIAFLTATLNWNPTDQLRVSFLYNHQQYIRVSDRSNVGLRRVPRLKAEYQVTPSLFVRLVGQYDSNFVDDLRDDSRTGRPILILNRSSGEFLPATARRRNSFRFDWLFSYRPAPGTVVFLGYGSSLSEPNTYRFRDLRRVQDGVFMKVSYLHRV